ncbi:UPF0481 protein [Iris pallida]|uniref:UPF0481 protein n=1 Tax=Iris pallida TaxID=29817 RepID=A0AAX6IHU4_IRIPA|nr:UPF0481 protein [Iris pallida]
MNFREGRRGGRRQGVPLPPRPNGKDGLYDGEEGEEDAAKEGDRSPRRAEVSVHHLDQRHPVLVVVVVVDPLYDLEVGPSVRREVRRQLVEQVRRLLVAPQLVEQHPPRPQLDVLGVVDDPVHQPHVRGDPVVRPAAVRAHLQRDQVQEPRLGQVVDHELGEPETAAEEPLVELHVPQVPRPALLELDPYFFQLHAGSEIVQAYMPGVAPLYLLQRAQEPRPEEIEQVARFAGRIHIFISSSSSSSSSSTPFLWRFPTTKCINSDDLFDEFGVLDVSPDDLIDEDGELDAVVRLQAHQGFEHRERDLVLEQEHVLHDEAPQVGGHLQLRRRLVAGVELDEA